MQATRNNLSDTKVRLTLTADQELLDKAKQQTLRALAKDMRLPGFRPGKAPLTLVEKNSNQNLLQQDFLDRAMNTMYAQALDGEKLRPVGQPEVTVKKFVPFSALEIDAEVDIIGDIKLADYKKLKLARDKIEITDADIKEVLGQLLDREAVREDVERTAEDGDQVIIDFNGLDSATREPISGAHGTAYPLIIGSNAFIPGFEPHLIGMEAGEDKTFDVTFPDDYGVEALRKRDVTFTVTIKKVQKVAKPALGDAFAATVGPFKTLDELKVDIGKQLKAEKDYQANRAYEEKLLNLAADTSTVTIPDSLIDAEVARMEADERQTLGRRGQTWQEHLEAEGITEEAHRASNREQAERRVKAGLVLAEIADKEKIEVSRDELEVRIQLLKGQYQDKAMRTELDKPENQREIASRLLTEKTVAALVAYADAT